MTETRPNGTAPMPEVTVGGRPYRPGAKDGRVLTAWQWIWDHLSTTEYTEGHELAERASARTGLKQSTLLAHLSRMAGAGVLATQIRSMPREVTRGGRTFMSHRPCAFYKISQRDQS